MSVSVRNGRTESGVCHRIQTSCEAHTLYCKQAGIWGPFAGVSGTNVIFCYLVVEHCPNERQNNFLSCSLTCLITR